MALLKIACMGNPVLRRKAAAVAEPDSEAMVRLVQDMRETLADSRGVGLAAPQVHNGVRLILFSVPGERNTEGAVPETVLFNPVIEPLAEETAFGWEGCLSVPRLRGLVPRWTHIGYRGLDASGRLVEREARGFHARVVQHEADHLDAMLYVDRMPHLGLLTFEEEMHNFRQGMNETAAGAPSSD